MTEAASQVFALVPRPSAENMSFVRQNAAPAFALVGGPALIWAGLSLEGTPRVRIALAVIGTTLLLAGIPQLTAEAKRLFG